MALLPKIKIKVLVIFPASVRDGIGVDLVKASGSYQFNLAYEDFAPPIGGVADALHTNALLWNSITGAYTLVPVSVLATGGAVPEAPNDGIQYGRKNLGWTPVTGSGGGSGTPSDSIPIMDGVGASGVAPDYSRGDHVHPSDTSRQLANVDLTAIAALTGTGIARRTTVTPEWTVGTPVVNAELAAMPAFTLKGNNTNGSSIPTDVDIAALTTKASPAGNDFLLVSDQAASGAWKKVAISTMPTTSGGSGNVVGPASAVDSNLAAFDTATGKLIKDSGAAASSFATPSSVAAAIANEAVRYDAVQALTAAQQVQARANIYAATFDAMAYNGMQINGSMEVSQDKGFSAPVNSGFICDGWQMH